MAAPLKFNINHYNWPHGDKWNDLAVMHLRSFHFGIFSRAKIPPDSQICGAILLCLEAEAAGTATSTVHRHRSYRPLTLHSYRHSGVNDRSLSSLGPNCVMTSKKFWDWRTVRHCKITKLPYYKHFLRNQNTLFCDTNGNFLQTRLLAFAWVLMSKMSFNSLIDVEIIREKNALIDERGFLGD